MGGEQVHEMQQPRSQFKKEAEWLKLNSKVLEALNVKLKFCNKKPLVVRVVDGG